MVGGGCPLTEQRQDKRDLVRTLTPVHVRTTIIGSRDISSSGACYSKTNNTDRPLRGARQLCNMLGSLRLLDTVY